jgi:SAM-dependent methyltransferase
MRERALEILTREFAGKPVRFLEVGIFEADTAQLFFRTIGATKGSAYFGCDVWRWGDVPIPQSREIADERLFRLEVLRWPHVGQAGFWIDGDIAKTLCCLDRGSLDLIYVDSSHKPAQTLLEATVCFELLKPGGLLLFDDYDFVNPITQEVRQAVDPFLAIYGDKLEVIDRDYQILVRKI